MTTLNGLNKYLLDLHDCDNYRVFTRDNVELSTCDLKGSSEVLFEQWKGERTIHVGPLDFEKFLRAFLNPIFSIDTREEKVVDFSKLH